MNGEFLIFSCEHAGYDVPAEHHALFAARQELLHSHCGWDIGALELASRLATYFSRPLYYTTTTRLLVENNRTLNHPQLFSSITRGLSSDEKKDILKKYYEPHQRRLAQAIDEALRTGPLVLHLAIHSFTPILEGKERRADIGLLYDPKRGRERAFCQRWARLLAQNQAPYRIRKNYPYRGTANSLMIPFRRRYPPSSYLGIEVEINQKYPQGERAGWQALGEHLVRSLERALSDS
jgi:predicted N-formylglutamate amidohydrolase